MQSAPRLKKVHSLDCRRRAEETAAAAQDAKTLATLGRPSPQAPTAPRLAHSVSIVVELAAATKTGDSPPGSPPAAAAATTPTWQPSCRKDSTADAPKWPATATDADKDASDEEEEAAAGEPDDDEEDAEACLGTNLARRVVVVDEADKIARSRARSAEPPEVVSQLRKLRLGTQQRHSLTCWWQQQRPHGLRSGSVSAATGDVPPRLGPAAGGGGPSETGCCGRQSHGTAHLCHLHLKQLDSQQQSQTHKRRQSLQAGGVFLGSGGGGGACQSTRSLTEEELRGEREFNEQLRAAKSPVDQTRASPATAHKFCFGRCAPSSPPVGSPSPPPPPPTLPLQCRRAHAHSRRVSFSSIELPPPAFGGAQACRQQRTASVCGGQLGSIVGQPPSCSQHEPQTTTTSLARHQLAPGRKWATCSGDAAPFANPQKRHSLAGLEPPPPCSSRADRFELPGQREEVCASGAAKTTWHKEREDSRRAAAAKAADANKQSQRDISADKDEAEDKPAATPPPPTTRAEGGFRASSAEAEPITSASTHTKKASPKPRAEMSSDSSAGNRKSFEEGGGEILRLVAESPTTTPAAPATSVAAAAAPTTRRPAGRNEQPNCKTEPIDKADECRVRSIMANARLRQEEFARLLEEHEQIVNEINRVETRMISAASQQKQRQTEAAPAGQAGASAAPAAATVAPLCQEDVAPQD